jgi:Tol biopolymer transport system component
VSLPGTGDYACTWSSDGREFYFTRSRSDASGPRQEIMMSRLGKGGWTAPVPASFSTGYAALEPHVTADGRRLYWAWARPALEGESRGNYHIYAAERTPQGWSEAKYVGEGMFVSSSRNGDVYVTELGERNAYLTKATMRNGRFARLERITGVVESLPPGLRNPAHPCIAPDGSYLVFDVEGGSHLFVSFLRSDGSWGPPVDLTEHGFDRGAGIASISPDGKYLFFGWQGDLYWVDAGVLAALRPPDTKAPPR